MLAPKNGYQQQHTLTTSTVASVGCFFAANTFYHWSLEGGKDVDWYTNHNIKVLGIYLYLSSICYYISFFVLFKLCFDRWCWWERKNTTTTTTTTTTKYMSTSSLSNLIRDLGFIIPALVLCCSVFLTLSLITRDTGVSFEKHGKFNLYLLIFALLIYLLVTVSVFSLKKYISIKKLVFGIIVCLLVVLVLYSITNSKSNETYHWSTGIDHGSLKFNDVEDTGVCTIKIPDSVPWSVYLPKILTYISTGGSSMCVPKQYKQFSTYAPDGTLTINCPQGKASFILTPDFFKGNNYLPYQDINRLIETYAPIERKYNYTKPRVFTDETVIARCGNNAELHIRNFKKSSVVERASKFNDPQVKNPSTVSTMTKEEKTKPIDIMFLKFNGLSRAHFKRAMPKTFSTLQRIQNDGRTSQVFQFFRYHAFKPDSYFNSISMFTGYNALKYSLEDQDIKGKSMFAHRWEFDPMFYQSFRKDSYVNAWIYGACADWYTKHLGKEGPIIPDHELILPFCSSEIFKPVHNSNNNNNNNNNNKTAVAMEQQQQQPFSIPKKCLAGKHSNTYIFQYINQFWNNYKDVGKISTISIMDTVQETMDINDYIDSEFNHFISSSMKPHLNDTALFIVGDNGSSVKNYYFNQDDSDQLEISMPTLYIILPTWFIERNPNVKTILKENENQLSTPFHLYRTLRALSKYPEFGGIDIQDPENKITDNGFLSSIPTNYNCKDLGIPHDFCQCK